MNRCNLISDLTLLRGVPWFVALHNRVEMPDSGALLMVKGASSCLVAIERDAAGRIVPAGKDHGLPAYFWVWWPGLI
jgi:hypothetical protein